MKKLVAALAVGIVASVLAACGTQPVVKLTPAQFAAIACPPVEQALALAPTFALTIPADVQAKVADATPIVTAFCAAGATVSVASVSTFANTVLPAASAVVSAAPANVLDANTKAQIEGGIALAQLGGATVTAIAENAAAAQAASAPVAASAAASQ
ncbi:hypothetical protein [Paraburkholderia sediminicola]|uniref:hypothetical protein n=1 Tax=Paraburkholderia sediminicola TaxID=458836 RepID=UPI0038BCCE55